MSPLHIRKLKDPYCRRIKRMGLSVSDPSAVWSGLSTLPFTAEKIKAEDIYLDYNQPSAPPSPLFPQPP